jgi:hypothetical protein
MISAAGFQYEIADMGLAKATAALSICACVAWSYFLAIAAAADAPRLVLPLACDVGRSCAIQQYVDHDASSGARDYRCGTLTYDRHNGTDFRLPTTAAQRAGVDVLAAAAGQVLRTRDGVPDLALSATTAPLVTGRECGNGVVLSHGAGWETQYCHLARASVRVKPGERVSAGQSIGRVGLSGRTQFPHLHLTVRHEGRIVDPFSHGAPEGACDGGTSLWSASARDSLAYRARAVLNVGFAPGPVSMAQIESGELVGNTGLAGAPALVAFVRAIGLKTGDVQRLSLQAPDGRPIADQTATPLDRDKAQVMLFVGRKRPDAGWPAGTYRASYTVTQNGRIALEETFESSF